MKLPLSRGGRSWQHSLAWAFVEQHRKGSHVKMKHPDGRMIIVPFHDEVDRYTLKGALRDADIEIADFLREVK